MEYKKSKEISTVMDIKIEHKRCQKGKVPSQVQSRKRKHARYRRSMSNVDVTCHLC